MFKIIRYGSFFLGISLVGFFFAGCGSSYNPGDFNQESSEYESANMQESSELEKAKQDAEEAEAEANRLREELNRKKQSPK